MTDNLRENIFKVLENGGFEKNSGSWQEYERAKKLLLTPKTVNRDEIVKIISDYLKL